VMDWERGEEGVKVEEVFTADKSNEHGQSG
jgi:hypothetical protein